MKRNFVYLAVVTVVALALVFIVTPTDRPAVKTAVNGSLLGAVAGRINEVDRVEIVTAGESTVATLVRRDGAWQVEQMNGYRADWQRLQQLLAALAQARVIEPKTDKPEYYARLGVEDISNPDAGSVLVKLGIGGQFTGVLIGKAADGRKGQYVRLQDSAGSVLVGQTFEVPKETLAWADSRIIDINSTEVAEVEIIHPGSGRVLVSRVSADETDFDLEGLPEGREVKSSWAVNSLGSVMSLLNMQSVRPAAGIDWENAVKLRLLTFSGLEIIADLAQVDDEYLLRLHATHPAASVMPRDPGSAVEGGQPALPAVAGDAVTRVATTEGGETPGDVARQAAADVAKQVDDINRKVEGWAYGISQQKYDNMVRKMEDLLKPPASS